VVGLNVGTSDTFKIGFNFVVPGGNNYQFTGGAFLGSLDIGTNSISLTLYSDSGGSPGVALETVNLANVLTSSIAIVPFSSAVNPVLVGGRQYWLTAAMTNPSSSRAYWWGPNPLDPGLESGALNGGPWTVSSLPRGAFEITGNLVPEPSALLLVGVNLFVLTFARWRKRRTRTARYARLHAPYKPCFLIL